MLKSMTIDNFKCFGEKTHIPLAPITLIYGQNSAGKSSILQVLSLLKQTVERAPAGTCLLPKCENGLVDLGSYTNLVHKHDTHRDFTFRLDFDGGHRWGQEPEVNGFDDFDTDKWSIREPLGYEVTMGRNEASKQGDHHVKRIAIYQRSDAEPAIVFDRSKSIKVEEDWGDPPPPPMLDGIATGKDGNKPQQSESPMVAVHALDRERPDDVYQCFCSENAQIVIGEALRVYDRWLRHGGGTKGIGLIEEFCRSKGGKEQFLAALTKARFALCIELAGFLPFRAWVDLPIEDRLLLLGRETSGFGLMADEADLGHIYGPSDRTIQSTRQERGEPENEPRFITRVGKMVRKLLKERLAPLAPIRSAPERWHILQGMAAVRAGVGYRGEWMQDLLAENKAICAGVSQWLKILANYTCEVKFQKDAGPEYSTLQLRDSLNGPDATPVSLLDVGYGLCQLLPVITQCVAAEGKIITIEQPEVHVHPKLQAELGDLFVQSYKKNGNQFIIETHSEHLLLRVRRLVRNGTLKPSDVSLLYVERGVDGSTVTPLKINSRGVITDPWPEGFFPDRLDEILGE